ncbi:MAG TPA: branched-chain amino acid ABC transporter ATP-binding protein/permease [Jiangellaceae bacterium]|nr:branched-chain amino acid ABC transporter ATP-binding protein/permease [Jiangellaceae bacterium]
MLEFIDANSATITLIALTAILAYSFYAVLIAGQLSLAQAGFASLAAFISVLAVPDEALFGVIPPLLVGVVVGMLVGLVAAFLLGLPVMRLRGVFLAIATLGFAEVVRIVLINMPWTGGAQGLSFAKLVDWPQAWIALILVAYWFWRLVPSSLGRALAAIREDDLAARSTGVDVSRYRMIAFLMAGATAGLYGVLLAHFSRFADPNEFGFGAAVDGLVTAVVGGTTMVLGPLLGSLFFTLVPEAQRSLGIEAGWIRPFVAGVLLLVVILFLPGGLAGLMPRRWRRRPVISAEAAEQLEFAPLPQTGTPLISLRGLGKDYGGVHAVRDVDLDLRAGEILGLIGPNGAGKTTLVNMVTGLVHPSSGSGTVLDVPLDGSVPAHDFALAGVGRTFQQIKLFERLSVLENVLVGAHRISKPTFLRRLLWLPSARRDEQATLAHAYRQLGRVGLDERAYDPAGDLSYGDRRRLEIARALAGHPTLLVLDEPAAGMNHVEAAGLSALIRSLAEDGVTVLFIEHNVRMVLDTCTRVVVLDFGEVIAAGDPHTVARDPRVVEAYMGSDGPTPGGEQSEVTHE